MAAAYALMWAAVLIYFISLARRERDIWAELQSLKDAIARANASPASDKT
jgi:hypothetical protein